MKIEIGVFLKNVCKKVCWGKKKEGIGRILSFGSKFLPCYWILQQMVKNPFFFSFSKFWFLLENNPNLFSNISWGEVWSKVSNESELSTFGKVFIKKVTSRSVFTTWLVNAIAWLKQKIELIVKSNIIEQTLNWIVFWLIFFIESEYKNLYFFSLNSFCSTSSEYIIMFELIQTTSQIAIRIIFFIRIFPIEK